MSAMRSVCGTVAANLVIGDMMSTCGRSCSEPILCWLSAPCPPIIKSGLSARNAVGDAGHRVGRARSRRRDDAADLAALARITVGGVRRHLFMTHVDDLDAFIEAAIVDVDDMTAAERPDHFDAFVLERLGDQMPAGDHRAGSFFFGFGISWRCHRYLTACLLEYHFPAANSPFGAHVDRAIGRSLPLDELPL